MVNVLIADDNVHFAINLMNQLNRSNYNIKVFGVAKDGKETIELINNETNNIDIILLDFKMPIYNGKEILDRIQNKNKYKKSCIIITGEIESVQDLYSNNMVYSVIYKTITYEKIIEMINELLNYRENIKRSNDLRRNIIREMVHLQYNLSHKGTQYLINIIEYIYSNPDRYLDNLENDIYPIISKRYGNSTRNIKSNIHRANQIMYCNCEADKLEKYFCICKNCKPNTKTIINTVINKMS